MLLCHAKIGLTSLPVWPGAHRCCIGLTSGESWWDIPLRLSGASSVTTLLINSIKITVGWH